jgi:lysophospholipase L1-like esterase
MVNHKISELPPAGPLGQSDVLPVVQGGVTKKVTVAGLAVLSRPGLSNYDNLIPIGPRTSANSQAALAMTSCDARLRVTPPVAVEFLELVFRNDLVDGPGAGDIIVSASLENGGTPRAIYFPSGRTVVIPPGGEARGFVAMDHDGPAAATPYFWVRTRAVVANGATTLPVNMANSVADGEGRSIDSTDLTLTGTHALGYGYLYGPSMILARAKATVPWQAIVALIGDSLTHGDGDTPNDRGWGAQALKGLRSYVKAAYSGKLASDLLTYDNTLWPKVQGATHGVLLIGTNDLNGGASLATLQSRVIAVWKRMAAAGMLVRGATIPPRSTSTDNWATTVNQTTAASNPTRVQFNNWMRDGAPMLNGVAVGTGTNAPGTVRFGETGHPLMANGFFDFAEIAESATNSGLWKVNGTANWPTTDGVHWNSSIIAMIAATINPATHFPNPA